MNTNLLDHLQEQGYEPQDITEDGDEYELTGDWYELTASGTGTVRVVIYPREDRRADVYALDAHMVCEWDVKFSQGTPHAAIIGVLEAAEWQLAERRGGPVTPAQAASA